MIVRQTGGKLPVPIPGSIRGKYQSFVIATLHRVVDPVIEQIKDKPQPWSIASQYYTDHVLMGNTAELRIGNRNPNWKWKEYDTHGEPRRWPPYKKGSRLQRWAQRNGLPAYPVARNIKMWGTTGNYLFTRIYGDAKPRIEAEIQAANAIFVASLMRGEI